MGRELKIFSYPAKELLLSAADRITVGRTNQNTLVIVDDSMSRLHAELRFFGNDWMLSDLASTNGTSLNGIPLLPRELTLIRSGDLISFGSYIVEVKDDLRESRKLSLLIFGPEQQYEGSFVIGGGTTFSYGGPQATIKSPNDDNGDLIFTIRIDDGKLIISPKGNAANISLNTTQVTKLTILTDKDVIKIGDHILYVSAPLDLANSDGYSSLGSNDNNTSQMQLPDYLKDRISHDTWSDPKGRRRKSTQSMLSMDVVSNQDSKSLLDASSYSAPELGAHRFTRPNLEAIKYEQEASDKRSALMGVITLVILLGMLSVLFNLYYQVIF